MYDDRDFFWSRGIATVVAGRRPGRSEGNGAESSRRTARRGCGASRSCHAGGRQIPGEVGRLARGEKGTEQLSPKPKAGDSEVEHTRNLTTMTAKGYLAAAEVRAGRDDAAKAIAVDYTNPGGALAEVHLFIGIAQARAGRKEAAQETFTNVVKLRDLHGAGNPSWYSIVSAQAAAGDLAGAVKSGAGYLCPDLVAGDRGTSPSRPIRGGFRKTIVQRLTEKPLSRCIAEQLVAQKAGTSRTSRAGCQTVPRRRRTNS